MHLRMTSHVLHVSEQLWLQLQQIFRDFFDCLKTGSQSWIQDNVAVLSSECHLPISWPVLSHCKSYNEFWCGSHKCWGAACGWKATDYLPLSVRINLIVSYGGYNDIVNEIYHSISQFESWPVTDTGEILLFCSNRAIASIKLQAYVSFRE